MVAVGDLIQHSPGLRRFVRRSARLVNPLVLAIAGRRWMPVVGVLHHRGRRSGREYALPVGMRPFAGGFVVPRTFGERAEWYLNLMAAGSGAVTYAGRRQPVVPAGVVNLEQAAPAFPRYERALFRILGIIEFPQLRHSEAISTPV